MQNEMASKPQMTHKPVKTGELIFMWIAHYSDGTSLPQYDPYTLQTHIFDEVEQDKLIKFGLYPFPSILARRLKEEKGIPVKSNIFLPKYEVDINKDRRVIGALTTNFIQTTNYIFCPTCKKWMKNSKFKLIDIGDKVKTYKCLDCGTQTYWECRGCGEKYNHLDDTNNWLCTKCGTKVKGHRIQFYEDSVVERWRIYKLGYQQTVKGTNHKTIMEISENGDVVMTYK